MKKSIFILILLCAIMTACSLQKMSIVGAYVSCLDQHIEDGVPCDVHLDMKEDFNYFSFVNNVDLSVTFYLDDSFDFPNMTMQYKVTVEGQWDCVDSLLTVDVDAETFKYELVGSNAESHAQEAMVRQLHKNVVKNDMMPKVKQKIIETSVRSVKVLEVNSAEVVVLNPITHKPLSMKRVAD